MRDEKSKVQSSLTSARMRRAFINPGHAFPPWARGLKALDVQTEFACMSHHSAYFGISELFLSFHSRLALTCREQASHYVNHAVCEK